MPSNTKTQPKRALYDPHNARLRPITAEQIIELTKLPVWTVPQFAAVYGHSRWLAYRLAEADNIPGCHVERHGNTLRIVRDAFMSPGGDAA